MHFWSHNSPAAPPVYGQPLQTQGKCSASSLTGAIKDDYLHYWHSHGTEIDRTEQGKERRKEGRDTRGRNRIEVVPTLILSRLFSELCTLDQPRLYLSW